MKVGKKSTWNLIIGLENTSPFLTLKPPNHQSTEDLYARGPFTEYIMFGFQQQEKQIAMHTKNTQFDKTVQASELNSEKTEMLGFLDQEFKKIIINMLRSVMDKIDNVWEWMDNINRKIEVLRKNQKEMLDIQIL